MSWIDKEAGCFFQNYGFASVFFGKKGLVVFLGAV